MIQSAAFPTATPKTPAQSRVVLSTVMMPEHANQLGNVHGGIIMKFVDDAAAIAAMRHAQRPAVTVAIDSMTFRRPVPVGSLLTCVAQVNFVQRSSMEVEVSVTAENPITREIAYTNSAYLVFVALGQDGKSTQVPRLILETPEDSARFEAGRVRQAGRLSRPPSPSQDQPPA